MMTIIFKGATVLVDAGVQPAGPAPYTSI